MTLLDVILLAIPLVALMGLGAYALASYDYEMRLYYRALRGEENDAEDP